MLLIIYYVAFMIVGDLAAYLIGLVAEHEWGSQVSLIAFLSERRRCKFPVIIDNSTSLPRRNSQIDVKL